MPKIRFVMPARSHALCGHLILLHRIHLCEERGPRNCCLAPLLCRESRLCSFSVSLLPIINQLLWQSSHSSSRMVGIEEEKLEREEDELQQRLPTKSQVGPPVRAFVVMWRPWSPEGVNDQIRRNARKQGDASHTRHPVSVESLQGVCSDLRIKALGVRLGAVQNSHQLIGILNGLAAALSQIRHHGMHSIAREDHIAISPRTKEFRPAVIQVSLFH
mmetsp:Transcript_39100/g.72874  ORF Transcript_39100/g.72874 Transcript_39100/m.72874 type:complete len:217 (-) Transcript_39100:1187-1837(-)